MQNDLIYNIFTDEQQKLDALMDLPVSALFDRQERCDRGRPVPLEKWNEYLTDSRRKDVQQNVSRARAAHRRRQQLLAEAAAARDAEANEEAERLMGEAKQAEEDIKAAKKSLPLYIPVATFAGKPRKNEFAQPTPYNALDIDDLAGDPREIWRCCLPKAEAAGVVMSYVSPKGNGLKIWFLRVLADIAADQEREYRALGLDVLAPGKLDRGCIDPSRGQWCTTDKDILFFNRAAASSPLHPLQPAPASAAPSGEAAKPLNPLNKGLETSAATSPAVAPASTDYPTEFEGVPLTAIARAYIKKRFGHEVPPEHQRHMELIKVAPALRWLTDFNAEWLTQILPANGLPQSEVMKICVDACKYEVKYPDMPQELRAVIDALKPAPEWDEYVERPVLPPGWQEVLDCWPAQMYDACLLSSLVCFGTLGSGARAWMGRLHKDDLGKLQSPTFQVVVDAPQGGGKGKIETLFELIMAPLRRLDAESERKEEEYRAMERRKKNAKELPPRPKWPVRIAPATVSMTELQRMQDEVGEEHLCMFSAEIEDAVKSRKRGPWADLMSVMRQAWDNGLFSTKHASADSFNKTVRLFINCLFTGTQEAVDAFFPSLTNGDITRFARVQIPYVLGARETPIKQLSSKARAKLDALTTRLLNIGGDGGTKEYDLGFLDKFMTEWVDHKGDIVRRTQDKALETFRRRARQWGFRVGLLAAAAWNAEGHWTKRMKERIIQTAHYVAELVLRGQMHCYGDRIRKAPIRAASTSPLLYAGVLKALPQAFSTADLAEAAKKAGYNLSAGLSAGKIAYKWVTAGAVKRTGHGKYEKVASQNPNAA